MHPHEIGFFWVLGVRIFPRENLSIFPKDRRLDGVTGFGWQFLKPPTTRQLRAIARDETKRRDETSDEAPRVIDRKGV